MLPGKGRTVKGESRKEQEDNILMFRPPGLLDCKEAQWVKY